MFSFIISLLVLSLMFSIISAAALLFRRTFLKGREGIMYPFWIVILIISIIPLRVNIAPIAAALDDEPSEQVHEPTVYVVHQDYAELPSAPDTAVQKSITEATESESTLLINLDRIKDAGIKFLRHITFEMLVLWLAGALLSFISAMIKFAGSRRLMLIHSAPCHDERIIRFVSEQREAMHIKRRIRVRMFDIDSLSSPCVVGLVRPTLFIEPGCLSLTDRELKCVITHELTHLRRFDILAKLICVFAASVHWFNPTARHVMKVFNEDCEMSCDYSVIKAYGNEVSGIYMNAIVDFAERYAKHCRLVCRDGVSSGLFASLPSGGVSFMKRRYTNMKNFRKNRFALTVTVIFTLICVLANMLVMSSCSAAVSDTNDTDADTSAVVEKQPTVIDADKLTPIVSAMIRSYYGLGSDDNITSDMLDAITDIKVDHYDVTYTERGHSDPTEYYSLIKFVVNDDPSFTAPLPELAKVEYFEELSGTIQANSATPDLPKSVDYQRFMAFFTPMEASVLDDPQMTDADKERFLGFFPNIVRDNAYYVLDPFLDDRESGILHNIMSKNGLLDTWTYTSEEFDASSFEYFENLEEIEFVDMTPVGYEFPDDVKVTLTTSATESQAEDTSAQ